MWAWVDSPVASVRFQAQDRVCVVRRMAEDWPPQDSRDPAKTLSIGFGAVRIL